MRLSAISLAITRIGRVSASFSPLSLFASGEQGAWYDPSDINNYMGPELIVNGTFDSNTDGWIPIEATASVVGGKCVVTNTSNTWGLVATELQVTVGDSYALSIYFDTTSGYDAIITIPGLLEDGISAGQTITYSATVVADTNPLTLYIGNADEVVGHNISFDNVSIRRIGEATMFQDAQGTTPVTADGQPVGLILDKSNELVLGPELATNGDFSNGTTGWVPNTGVSLSNISNQLVQTSTSIGWLSSFLHVTGVTPGNTYKISIDVVGGSVSSSRYLNVGTNAGGYNIFQTQILSNGTLVCYATATLNYFDIGTECFFNNIGDTVILDNVSVKLISGNHASQATAAKRPLYKTSGGLHWLQFDGVDDSLSTAAIDFTSTDKMSVFSGVRKISDVATGVYFETSGDASVNAGAVRLSSPSTAAAATYGFTFRGTTAASQGSAATFSAPITNVLTTTFDGSQSGLANQVKARVNGSLQVLSVGSNGDTVGSMGNYVTYVGTRNGAWPLNGRIYSLIILGRLATTQEVTDTETWVAGKTGVVL